MLCTYQYYIPPLRDFTFIKFKYLTFQASPLVQFPPNLVFTCALSFTFKNIAFEFPTYGAFFFVNSMSNAPRFPTYCMGGVVGLTIDKCIILTQK